MIRPPPSSQVLRLFHFECTRPTRFQDEFYLHHSRRLYAQEDVYYCISHTPGTGPQPGAELRMYAVEPSMDEEARPSREKVCPGAVHGQGPRA